jgi:hypothetical protein
MKAQEEDLSNYKKRKSEDSSSQDNDNSIKKAKEGDSWDLNSFSQRRFFDKLKNLINQRLKLFLETAISLGLQFSSQDPDELPNYFQNNLSRIRQQAKNFYLNDGSANEKIWIHFECNVDIITGKMLRKINSRLIAGGQPSININKKIKIPNLKKYLSLSEKIIYWGDLEEKNIVPNNFNSFNDLSEFQLISKIANKIYYRQKDFFRQTILENISLPAEIKDQIYKNLKAELASLKLQAKNFYIIDGSLNDKIWSHFLTNIDIISGRIINEINSQLIAHGHETLKETRKNSYTTLDYLIKQAKKNISWGDLDPPNEISTEQVSQTKNNIDETILDIDKYEFSFDSDLDQEESSEVATNEYINAFENEDFIYDTPKKNYNYDPSMSFWEEYLSYLANSEEVKSSPDSIQTSQSDNTNSYNINNNEVKINKYSDNFINIDKTASRSTYQKEKTFKEESHQLNIKIKYIDEFLEELPEWIQQNFSKLKAFLEEIHLSFQSIFSNYFTIKFVNYALQDSSIDEICNNKNEYKAQINYNISDNNFEFMLEPEKFNLEKLVAIGSADINNLFNNNQLII